MPSALNLLGAFCVAHRTPSLCERCARACACRRSKSLGVLPLLHPAMLFFWCSLLPNPVLERHNRTLLLRSHLGYSRFQFGQKVSLNIFQRPLGCQESEVAPGVMHRLQRCLPLLTLQRCSPGKSPSKVPQGDAPGDYLPVFGCAHAVDCRGEIPEHSPVFVPPPLRVPGWAPSHRPPAVSMSSTGWPLLPHTGKCLKR